MESSIISIDNKKYDILFIVQNDKFNYVAYKKNDKICFAKYKDNSTSLKDVTEKEIVQLELILNKLDVKE